MWARRSDARPTRRSPVRRPTPDDGDAAEEIGAVFEREPRISSERDAQVATVVEPLEGIDQRPALQGYPTLA